MVLDHPAISPISPGPVMRHALPLAAALLAVPGLLAQEKKPPTAPDAAHAQDPKVKEHEALRNLVGDWELTCKASAMPGVPGMEKASESKGTEHTELICNGLFLKSSMSGTWQGKPMQVVWLAGYDPIEKKYTTLCVSSEDEPGSAGTGSYDEKTRTWSFAGNSPQGRVRSSMVFKDSDNSVETCYLTPQGGKEGQMMEITRKRTSKPSAPVALDASARAPSKEVEALHDGLGTWTATVKMAASKDHPASEDKATEKSVLICGGRWVWSDFNGTMMNGPFEGHGIVGYDSAEKKYVSYWFDSMAASYMKTTGTHDPATKTCTFDGKTVDAQGKPVTVHQEMSQPDPNTRVLKMTFKGEQGTEQMEITYKKASKN
jgi:hypothetical protein